MRHDTYLALPPAREEKQPRFLTESEYKRLMETVRFQVRDAALIEILLQQRPQPLPLLVG
jgi:integrase